MLLAHAAHPHTMQALTHCQRSHTITHTNTHTHSYYEYLPCSYTDSPEDRKAEEAGNFSPDSVDREDLCCFWFAGEDFKTGDELCNRYGYMAPDQVCCTFCVLCQLVCERLPCSMGQLHVTRFCCKQQLPSSVGEVACLQLALEQNTHMYTLTHSHT